MEPSLQIEEQPFPIKKAWILLIICGLATILTGFFFYSLLNPNAEKGVFEIQDSWTLYEAASPEHRLLSKNVSAFPNIAPGETLVMERTMVEEIQNAELMIKANHQWVKIFLDDTLLLDSRDAHATPGIALHSVHLPSDYLNKQLRIEITSPFKSYSGLPAKVYTGVAIALNAYIFSHALPQLLIFAVGFTLGTILMIYAFFYYRRSGQIDTASLLLCCFAFLISFDALLSGLLAGLLFSPHAQSSLSTMTDMLIPVFLTSFYLKKMQYCKNYYRILVIFTIIMVVAAIAMDVLNVQSIVDSSSIINRLFVISALLTALASTVEAFNHNQFYLVCSPGIVIAAIFHSILYLQNSVYNFRPVFIWADLAFALLMILFCSYSIWEFAKRSEQARQKIHFLQVKTHLLEENQQDLLDHAHDINHLKTTNKRNLQLMQQMAHNRRFDSLTDFIDELAHSDVTADELNRFSEHETVDLILQYYKRKAKKRSIDLQLAISLPADTTIPEEDLQTLLIHILEPTLRKVGSIFDPKKRNIFLRITDHEHHLTIECDANSFNKHFSESSTAAEKTEVIDLHLLQKIAAKYSGAVSYEEADQIDRMRIQLIG